MCLTDKKQEMAFNRLIHEKSPYLLQYAGNPVDWYPWKNDRDQLSDISERITKHLYICTFCLPLIHGWNEPGDCNCRRYFL